MKDKNTKKEQPSLKDRLAQWKPMPFRDWLKQNWIALVVLAVAAAIFVGMYFYSHQGKIYQNQSTELENLSYETATVLNVSRDTVQTNDYAATFEVSEVGSQTILIRITSGVYTGLTLELQNNVSTFSGTKLRTGVKMC